MLDVACSPAYLEVYTAICYVASKRFDNNIVYGTICVINFNKQD